MPVGRLCAIIARDERSAIRLLGSPHIELDGRPAALETRKATALLAYLAVRLSKAFGRSPEGWLRLQMQFDLAQITRRADDIQVNFLCGPNR